jgi:hypothetical protein
MVIELTKEQLEYLLSCMLSSSTEPLDCELMGSLINMRYCVINNLYDVDENVYERKREAMVKYLQDKRKEK